MAIGRGVVLDTDVVIDFLRGHGDGVAGVRRAIGDGGAFVSSVTAYELRQGALTPDDQVAVGAFCGSRTLPLTLPAALRAGEVGAALRSAGTPIGPADTLIAGLCLHHRFSLMTKNSRHFGRVLGLSLRDPTAS
jgi:tRNA(fMet)-specific endonuclease VapC